MSFSAIADHFCARTDLPIAVDHVLDWIRENTDHKLIELHGVKREGKGYRGGFRRKAIPVGAPYSGDFEILTQIFYGVDLPEEWKRLVIVKEAMHVFDPQGACVDRPEFLRKLIPGIMEPGVLSKFQPAFNDEFGECRAMALLVPRGVRIQLAAAVDSGERTVAEAAAFARVPDVSLDIWLRYGDEIENYLLPALAGDAKLAS